MRVAIIAMVRDECDVIASFVAHHAGLADRLVIADHRSIDGTRGFLTGLSSEAAECDLEVLRYEGTKYHQSPISTALARREFRSGADWVIVLDADEFLDVADRSELRSTLVAVDSSAVVFTWLNLLPSRPVLDAVSIPPFRLDQAFVTLSGDRPPERGKVAVRRDFWQSNPRFVLPAGNHRVLPRHGATSASLPVVGRLLHVPARSVGQILRKRRNLNISQSRLGARYAEAAAHAGQFELARQVSTGGTREARTEEVLALMESVVLHYEGDLKDLPRSQWSVRPVSFPSSRPGPAFAMEGHCRSVPLPTDPIAKIQKMAGHHMRGRIVWHAVVVRSRIHVVTGPVGWARRAVATLHDRVPVLAHPVRWMIGLLPDPIKRPLRRIAGLRASPDRRNGTGTVSSAAGVPSSRRSETPGSAGVDA